MNNSIFDPQESVEKGEGYSENFVRNLGGENICEKNYFYFLERIL